MLIFFKKKKGKKGKNSRDAIDRRVQLFESKPSVVVGRDQLARSNIRAPLGTTLTDTELGTSSATWFRFAKAL